MFKKFGVKFAVIAMAVIVVVVAGILVVVMNATNTLVGDMLLEQSQSANKVFAKTFEGYQDEALQRAEMIAGSTEVVNAVKNGDHDALLSALKNLSAGLDLITLCDAEGNVLARTHNDKVGDSVLSQKAISIALSTGKGIKTIEPGTVIGLSTRGSAAIKDPDGNIIGALTCGHDLSQIKYIDDIKAKTGYDATFFAGDTRMSTTLVDEKGERVIGTKASDAVIETVINKKQDFNSQIKLFGTTYQVCYTPVIVDNQVVGMLFTGVHAEAALNQKQTMIILIVIAAVMLLLAVVITAVVINWTTKKTYWYEGMLDSIPFPISVTDMHMKWTFINKPVEQMLNVKRADVLGKPCSNWGAAICKTNNCGIDCLKGGKNITFFEQMGANFQVNISYLYNAHGKQDGHIEIVQDISDVVKTQNAQAELIADISKVSSTFTTGSKQISDGAQALAQGSTQQAAAVEQLSSSVSEIAQQTKVNAEMAMQASKLANTIKNNAEKGSHQMDQMMIAVKEINQASQNINKVIKVIDDIAFQTNILALNAAVEAARAGQHGKGFAVVAEEVRNLASKSAAAANDTGTLIANSMEKAELGAKIADETAASLVEIVAGINESSKIVGEIAKSSENQSVGIGQINRGIDQVAQVVQQNSATAEESAAASVSMSEQAIVLENLITQFEAKNDSKSRPALKEAPERNTSANASKSLPSHNDYGKY